MDEGIQRPLDEGGLRERIGHVALGTADLLRGPRASYCAASVRR